MSQSSLLLNLCCIAQGVVCRALQLAEWGRVAGWFACVPYHVVQDFVAQGRTCTSRISVLGLLLAVGDCPAVTCQAVRLTIKR
jgi:hypothetical protein